jgi:hypothetical protein
MDNFSTLPRLKIVVCDIDGCLVDSSHRTDLYFSGQREAYVAAAKDDKVIPQGQAVYRSFLMGSGFYQLFVTSRGDWPDYRAATLAQLHKFVSPTITDDQLLMRPKDKEGLNVMSDEDYKPWAITNAGFHLDDVWMAFDDREDVVAMWRKRGVVCYHTQPGLY